MFWIPISVLVCIIAYAVSISNSVRTARTASDINRFQSGVDELVQRSVDPQLERELEDSLNLRLDEWKELVREFMGGAQDWADYVDFTSGKMKALMVRMSRRGKLPVQCVRFGVTLPCGYQINPDRAIQMNEEFILRTEYEMCMRTGLDIRAYVWTTLRGDSTYINMPLREFQRQYGYGQTHFSTRFQFIIEKG